MCLTLAFWERAHCSLDTETHRVQRKCSQPYLGCEFCLASYVHTGWLGCQRCVQVWALCPSVLFRPSSFEDAESEAKCC